MEKSDRGSLLLSAPVRHAHFRVGMAALYMVIVAGYLFEAWRDYESGKEFGSHVMFAVLWFALGLVFLLPKTVKFYEKGIQIPRNQDNHHSRGRFLPWSEVERYHWDGDALYFVQTESVLKTGGISVLGEPWAILPRSRTEVDAILSRYVPQGAIS